MVQYFATGTGRASVEVRLCGLFSAEALNEQPHSQTIQMHGAAATVRGLVGYRCLRQPAPANWVMAGYLHSPLGR